MSSPRFQTELHMHTSEVSMCAKLTAPQMADLYIRAGYHSVVVTNHYSPTTAEAMGENWSTDRYLEGYRLMKEYARGKLCVLLGAELRFYGDSNDYLLYGLTEDFLYGHPDLHKSKLKDFSPLAREHGILVIQAHPFRNGMTVRMPELLDGVEVFNANTETFRNQIALDWARHYGLLGTSGSDLHSDRTVIGGGLLTEEPIESNEELVRILKARTAALLRKTNDPSCADLGLLPATLEESERTAFHHAI